MRHLSQAGKARVVGQQKAAVATGALQRSLRQWQHPQVRSINVSVALEFQAGHVRISVHSIVIVTRDIKPVALERAAAGQEVPLLAVFMPILLFSIATRSSVMKESLMA